MIRSFQFSLLLAALMVVFSGISFAEPTPETSIIRVNSTLQKYSFIRPWEKGAPSSRRGLGALISGNRVLTTAEMCENATFLELEHPSSGAKVPARIIVRDYEANLALLEPAEPDSGVFDGVVPMERTSEVEAGDKIEVWQIEDNGDGVTTDVEVIRVTVDRYFLSRANYLVYKVKGSLQARVNSFTLPVIQDGKLAGVLLSYNSKEQTANILPMPIIESFLADAEDGEYNGIPNLGVAVAQTLDKQLREFSGIADKEGGIFVRKVATDSSAEAAGIEVSDIIMSIAGHPIDSRGNYVDDKYGKLSFSHIVGGNAKVGDKIKIDLIRDGKEKTIDLELKRKDAADHLVDPYMFDRGPKFLILGGLIFQELTRPYLESWGDQWTTRAPFKLVYANANQQAFEKEGRDKLVFLSNVLKTPSTLGYEDVNSVVVTSVNGKPVNNIQELHDRFAEVPENGIHTIELDGFPKVIYVRDDTSRQVNEQLLQYGIGDLQRLQ